MLCPGCSHRGVFYVLQRLRAVVFGDIGCYTLGALPPLNATHTCGPMGASVGMAHGVDKVGVKDRTVAVLGDSTFFHSGMSPLVNIVTNGGVSTTIVVDNSVTAMTGHQTNPGTGRTLMGEESPAILIENVAKALGYEKVDVIDPYDLQNTRKVLTDHLDSETPSVVVVRAPCILHTRETAPRSGRGHRHMRCVRPVPQHRLCADRESGGPRGDRSVALRRLRLLRGGLHQGRDRLATRD